MLQPLLPLLLEGWQPRNGWGMTGGNHLWGWKSLLSSQPLTRLGRHSLPSRGAQRGGCRAQVTAEEGAEGRLDRLLRRTHLESAAHLPLSRPRDPCRGGGLERHDGCSGGGRRRAVPERSF